MGKVHGTAHAARNSQDLMNNETESFANDFEEAAVDVTAENKFETSKDHATRAAHEAKEAAMLKARAYKGAAINRAEDVRRKVETSFTDARSRAEAKTREDPMKSLAVAFGAGFIAGIIFRR